MEIDLEDEDSLTDRFVKKKQGKIDIVVIKAHAFHGASGLHTLGIRDFFPQHLVPANSEGTRPC